MDTLLIVEMRSKRYRMGREVLGYILSQAYGYATYLGIDQLISKCDYTEDDLLEIYKFAPVLEKR